MFDPIGLPHKLLMIPDADGNWDMFEMYNFVWDYRVWYHYIFDEAHKVRRVLTNNSYKLTRSANFIDVYLMQ